MAQKGISRLQGKSFMKGDKLFLDTNILIYAYDISAGKKHDIAVKIVMDLWDSGYGCISTQVLQEFFINITAKIQKPLDVDTAKELIRDFLKWNVVINDGESILEAIDFRKKYKYSFWDSMIIQAAVKGGAKVLLSEDLSDGHIIRGVQIKNPFA